MGRLGKLFAFQSIGVRPDVITIAKATTERHSVNRRFRAPKRRRICIIENRLPSPATFRRSTRCSAHAWITRLHVTRGQDVRGGSSRMRGLLLNAAGDNTLRFVPPLTITLTQIDDMRERFERIDIEISKPTPIGLNGFVSSFRVLLNLRTDVSETTFRSSNAVTAFQNVIGT